MNMAVAVIMSQRDVLMVSVAVRLMPMVVVMLMCVVMTMVVSMIMFVVMLVLLRRELEIDTGQQAEDACLYQCGQ